jgi:hypothetical protein
MQDTAGLEKGAPVEPPKMPDRPSPVVTYRKAHLKVAESFFQGADAFNARGDAGVDVVRHRSCSRPVAACQSAESYTLWVNLKENPKYLLARMSRTTRSQIRRAEREDLRYEFNSRPTSTWTEQFFDFYEIFANSKKLHSVDRRKVLAMISQSALDLSRMSTRDGRVLVWHAHLRCGAYACCLYSASLFRGESKSMAGYIGRANRLHHWYDMLRFRDEGFSVYDLGGWYPGKDNEALLRVNRFKKGFGAGLVLNYNCDQGLSWKGVIALWLRGLFLRTQSGNTRPVTPARG